MPYRNNAKFQMCAAHDTRWYAKLLKWSDYICTLPLFHVGDHIAEGNKKYPICHRWKK